MGLVSRIKEYGMKLGIDKIGITTAEPFPELKKFLEEMDERKFLSKFVKKDFGLITDPQRVLPGAKSIIVCAISYLVDDKYISFGKEKTKRELRGKLSRFARGRDYHKVLEERLDKLIKFLAKEKKGLKAKKFVDTGPLVDRALARRGGIGWQGKNCNIMNPDYGSWIFLGEIITNLDLSPDSPIENKCGDCQECIEACPMGALKEPYILDSNRCLGYITLKKGYIKESDREKMGDRLWGCDTCQEVCPYNKQAKAGNHPEFMPQNLAAYPRLLPLLKLTDKRYKDLFGETPMNWRGKIPIQRNAAIILGNLGDERAVSALEAALFNSKSIIREHVDWALSEIKNKTNK